MHNLVIEKYNQSEKVRQSKGSVFYFLSNFYKRFVVLENRLPRAIYMEIIIIIITWIFTPFPNLIVKESYNWWLTRRVWGFRHQISKAKYLKMSVANIGKL